MKQKNTGRFERGQIPHNTTDLNSLVQVGQMFGSWRVESSEMRREKSYRLVLVSCPHVKETWRSYDNLRSGKSTGCLKCGDERTIKYKSRMEQLLSKRGQAAKCRCNNRTDPGYENYGARGIKFLFSSVESYVEYCKNLPDADTKLEIDRIDNDGNYEPGNLRWATKQEQACNTRRTRHVEFQGKEMSITNFTKYHTFLSTTRVRKLLSQGMSTEEVSKITPKVVGRRSEGIRLGKLRPEESVHGRKLPTNDDT